MHRIALVPVVHLVAGRVEITRGCTTRLHRWCAVAYLSGPLLEGVAGPERRLRHDCFPRFPLRPHDNAPESQKPSQNDQVAAVEKLIGSLDDGTASLVRPALATLLERSRPDVPTSLVVQEFLTRDLPRHEALGEGAKHEVAWALGDLFERAGLHKQAAVCRSARTHETLAVQRWVRSFVDVPEGFWLPALSALGGWRRCLRGQRCPCRAPRHCSTWSATA